VVVVEEEVVEVRGDERGVLGAGKRGEDY